MDFMTLAVIVVLCWTVAWSIDRTFTHRERMADKSTDSVVEEESFEEVDEDEDQKKRTDR